MKRIMNDVIAIGCLSTAIGISGYSTLSDSLKKTKLDDSNIIVHPIQKTNDIKGIKDIAIDLMKKDRTSFDAYIKQLNEKSDVYDIKFLVCIGSLYNDNFDGNINGKDYNKKVDFYDSVTNNKPMFWLEEIFHHDVPKICDEIDKLEGTKNSKFIFRSNLVNFAIMLNCYHRHGFDKFFSEHKYTRFDNDHISDIHIIFEQDKNRFVSLLIDAYDGFSYFNIQKLYIFYLNFYNKVIGRKIYPDFNTTDYDDAFRTILNVLKYNPKFMYLSFNLQDGYKMAPFEFTNLIISHIGYRPAHNVILNPIMVIEHDLTIHKQHERIKINKKYQKLVLLLYNNFYNYDGTTLNAFQKKYLEMTTDKNINTMTAEERKNICRNIYFTSLNIIYYAANEHDPYEKQCDFEKIREHIEHLFCDFNDVRSISTKTDEQIDLEIRKIIHDKEYIFVRTMTPVFCDNNINKDKNIKYFSTHLQIVTDFELSECHNCDKSSYDQVITFINKIIKFEDALNTMYTKT